MNTIKLKSNYKSILVMFGLLICISSHAQNIVSQIEDEKEVSSSSVIYISNTTDIEVHTWDKQMIKNKVEIIVDPVDRLQAQELVKQFNFEIDRTLFGNIEMEYDLGIEKMGEFSDNKIKTPEGLITIVMKNGKIFTVKNIRFDIVVYIPRNNELVMKSRFSKVSLGNLTNKVALDLTGVTLKGSNLNVLELDASYSNIQLNEVINAEFDVGHCNIKIASLGEATIDSDWSDFEIQNGGHITIDESIEGIIEIKNISTFISDNSSYTNFKFGVLKNSADIDSKYGDIVIETINKEFSHIKISDSFSAINISTVDVDALFLHTDTKYSKFNFPEDIKPIDSKDRIRTYYKGTKSADQKISIDCISCNITFK